MARSRLWVLALNATQARILRDVRRGEDQEGAEPDLLLQAEQRKPRGIEAGRPRRGIDPAGARRPQSRPDPVQDAERAFARQAADLLERHRKAGNFTRLAVFAAPEMLGHLRPALSCGLRGTLVDEVPKNLLHLAAQDLRRTVAAQILGD